LTRRPALSFRADFVRLPQKRGRRARSPGCATAAARPACHP
jgi:hypothetical protein